MEKTTFNEKIKENNDLLEVDNGPLKPQYAALITKKDKKIRPSRMHSRKSCCYIFSYTLVRLSISLCTFSSITFFFLEIAL